MDLYPTSVEYATSTLTFSETLQDVVEFAVLRGDAKPTAQTTWTAGEWVGPVTTTGKLRMLLAGPEAEETAGAVKLARGSYKIFVRLQGNPELVIRRLEGGVEVL